MSAPSSSEPVGTGAIEPLVLRCPECGDPLELGHDCLADFDDRDEYDCTICGGDGTCMDNSDPLWDCDDLPHACHACRGTGRRSDQRYF